MTGTLTRHMHVEHVMGTVVSFDVRGGDEPSRAIEDAVRWLHGVDAEFSTYRPDSAVCRYDGGEIVESAAGDDLRLVIDRCRRLKRDTGGYFDAYANGSFDPSAFVKGWAVQRAADSLRTAGLDRFCINAGGDVVAFSRDGDDPWRVGVRHPHDPRAVAAVIEVHGDTAVATSGLYERGGHIIDPRSGLAPADVLSVTVVGRDLGLADAYATAAFAMGSAGAEWTLGLDGYSAMTILANETVLTTPGFPEVKA